MPNRSATRRAAALRRALCAVVACAFAATALSSCSDTDRTAGRFCAELQAELPALTTPPRSSDDVEDLLRRFEKLNGITPLAIEDEWQILTDLVEQASNVVVGDPVSRQELADAAYRAERPARDMTYWVESTCGFLMPDVIGIEGDRLP